MPQRSILALLAIVLLAVEAGSNKQSTLPDVAILKGVVDDCCCEVENVDKYNNGPIHSLLSELTNTTFFSYFKVNYLRDCPFWAENYLCTLEKHQGGGCGVCECTEEEIPEPWKHLDRVETSVADNPDWTEHEEEVWTYERDDEPGMVYLDLRLNPERYTGYSGYNATRIWYAIYSENCFQDDGNGLCKEERLLNRLVSGFHGSTSAHIAENYFLDGKWQPNIKFFLYSLGKFPERLENIYFTYLVVARAIAKASKTLVTYNYNTGQPSSDDRTRELINQLINQELLCSPTFEETEYFQTDASLTLRQDMRSRFLNISQMMDCVECETCKIHAKLQMLGIGTALKILIAKNNQYSLERNEIIALINTFHKFSESITIIQGMRERVAAIKTKDGRLFTGFADNWFILCCIVGLFVFYHAERRQQLNRQTKDKEKESKKQKIK